MVSLLGAVNLGRGVVSVKVNPGDVVKVGDVVAQVVCGELSAAAASAKIARPFSCRSFAPINATARNSQRLPLRSSRARRSGAGNRLNSACASAA